MYRKYTTRPSNCTLEDVEQFKKTLTQKLLVPSFTIFLRDAEQGCISLTWLITSVITTLLCKDIHNIKLEWFKEHHIERLIVDGQDMYSSAVSTCSTFLRKLYTSQKTPSALSSNVLPQKLFPFKLDRIEKEKISMDEFTRQYLRGDADVVGSIGTAFYQKTSISVEEVGKLSKDSWKKLILIEGAPGVGFSWELFRMWGRGVIFCAAIPYCSSSHCETTTWKWPNSVWPLLPPKLRPSTGSDRGGHKLSRPGSSYLAGAMDHDRHEKASVFLDLIHGRILPLATVFVTSRPWASEHLTKNCESSSI